MTEPGEYSDVEYVFEPHSAALPDLREYLAALWERRQFMVELARADLRSTSLEHRARQHLERARPAVPGRHLLLPLHRPPRRRPTGRTRRSCRC